ncbi:hypothetical protein LOAG_11145 [Loa loa]|uniref:Uncharacterized protein n=1 Tax=Loa loa TaxID=7209 RepID=A0A1I7VGV9_LOALO|nr:hypothetical protein LOAG_11145 [Loa loa]EFO17354.2 hypothetical protein LOAG_11145 [Loa loa]
MPHSTDNCVLSVNLTGRCRSGCLLQSMCARSAMLKEGAHLPYAFAYDKADGAIIVQRGSVARTNAADVDHLRMRAVPWRRRSQTGGGKAKTKEKGKDWWCCSLLSLLMPLLSGSLASTGIASR